MSNPSIVRHFQVPAVTAMIHGHASVAKILLQAFSMAKASEKRSQDKALATVIGAFSSTAVTPGNKSDLASNYTIATSSGNSIVSTDKPLQDGGGGATGRGRGAEISTSMPTSSDGSVTNLDGDNGPIVPVDSNDPQLLHRAGNTRTKERWKIGAKKMNKGPETAEYGSDDLEIATVVGSRKAPALSQRASELGFAVREARCEPCFSPLLLSLPLLRRDLCIQKQCPTWWYKVHC